ncbi:mannitol dehydrogenase family protein [Aliiruegeria sabulilitoris]|uniref:mannitol dehydrogenase family protein n=1 Tax=Aliiruegeria sabulilitoris TaxID=1510458 RepID=UPI000830E763|nr:mannitol dehydrogenase family protein [Aliiruegeria sabulilitoris]NDR59587.1 mannitol dehydrogenase family protein [Pseudoruegeria sp. M32A2M]
MDRLNASRTLSDTVKAPGYVPSEHGTGIVHIGLGAFVRAHLAAYTDAALAASGGDWRIVGVSLRSTAPVEELEPQDGLYTLIERGAAGTEARVIGALSGALSGATQRAEILAAMTAPATRIVSLTVTEKGYGVDRATGGADPSFPAVAEDLESPTAPGGVLGLIVRALELRRTGGVAPFTVLCCDNLPENGAFLRAGVLDFARRLDPDLADWIAQSVAFPSTMVDRITPARTDRTLADAAALTGFTDAAAIETEPFTQWVIEDRFPTGRPDWDVAGAIFVEDVAPYEHMKLRMLNGTHSMLAYAGFLSGHRYVRDTMADPAMRRLIERHLAAAAATLAPLPGIDFTAYADELCARFINPEIAHETYQIAMDGTQKLPQRILRPAMDAASAGQSLRPFAFATAAWMRYTLGRKDDGTDYALRDPLEEEIQTRLDGLTDAAEIVSALCGLPGLFPEKLLENPDWNASVTEILAGFLQNGAAPAIEAEADMTGA